MHLGRPALITRRRAVQLLATSTIASLLISPARAQTGNILRIGHPLLDQDWSPLRGGGVPFRWNALWCATGMVFDSDASLLPYIFTQWQGSDDDRTWEFKLDLSAGFSDGSRITASEVKQSWELAAMPASGNQRIDQVLSAVLGYRELSAGDGAALEGIEVVDDITLRIRLEAPDPLFFKRVATQIVPIVPPGARLEDGNERPQWWLPEQGLPVSGPFRFAEVDLAAGKLTLVPNEKFFGPKPRLDRIDILTVTDTTEAVAMLQGGLLDAHSDLVTPSIVKDLGKAFSSGPMIPKGHHFWLNVGREPTNDINVRRALIMAVDRQKLFDLTFPDGPNERADQLLNAVSGVDPNHRPHPFDPEAARQALMESSFGSAAALPWLEFAGISNPSNTLAADFIASQWKLHLGITKVRMLPQVDRAGQRPEEAPQIFRDDVGTRVPDAVAYLEAAIQSGSSNAMNKLGGYINPEVDAALAEGGKLGIDNPGRDFLARQAMRAFHADFAMIPWYHETMSRWAMPYVTGIDKNLDWQVVRPWDIAVER